MTAPQVSQATPDMTGQVLIKLGEMSAQLAAMDIKLSALPDHEQRIRVLEAVDVAEIGENKSRIEKLDGRVAALEKFRYMLAGSSFAGGVIVSALGYWVGHIVR